MKKQRPEIEKVGKLIAVKIYFTDAQLVDRIGNIADGLGLSLSGAAGMVIRAGIDVTEKAADEIIGKKNEAKKKIKQ